VVRFPQSGSNGNYAEAMCDYLDQMRADAASWRPQAVVIEFGGIAINPRTRLPDALDITHVPEWVAFPVLGDTQNALR
jgi:hypothetical protein